MDTNGVFKVLGGSTGGSGRVGSGGPPALQCVPGLYALSIRLRAVLQGQFFN